MINLIIGAVVLVLVLFLVIVFNKNLKSKLQERIEKNAVKIPNVTYSDIGGEHKEDIIIKRSQLPLIGDWTRIYPPIDEYGKINWINAIFGGKKNFIKLLIICGIVAIILLGYYELFSQISALKDNCVPFIN